MRLVLKENSSRRIGSRIFRVTNLPVSQKLPNEMNVSISDKGDLYLLLTNVHLDAQ